MCEVNMVAYTMFFVNNHFLRVASNPAQLKMRLVDSNLSYDRRIDHNAQLVLEIEENVLYSVSHNRRRRFRSVDNHEISR